MDIPDLTVPDIGDTGSTPPLTAQAAYDPPPLRSSSPPLPPRKNALGLPPTYLAHLRALLHQWLTQQTTSGVLPSTADRPDQSARLWDDQRVQAIEKAIWSGAIIPGDKDEGKRRLLDLDWSTWAPGAAQRKRLWRETHPHADSEHKDKTVTDTLKGKRRPQSINTEDGRGSLAAPPTGLSSLSAASTPQRIPSRPSSVASTERTWRGDGARSPLGVSPSISEGDARDPEERERDFYSTLMGLKGFKRLVTQSKDEWEVFSDDLPPPITSERTLPGAFPQSGHYRDPSPMPQAPTLPPKPLPPGPSIAADDLVKPLFCLHFPASPSEASTSTVHLRRRSSLGHGSNSDSVGSIGASWWSAGGSGRRWSGIGLGMGRDTEEEIEVEFVEGQFALPSSTRPTMSPSKVGRKSSQRRKQRSETAESASSATGATDTSDADGDDDDDDDDDDHSSAWSGTQRAGSRTRRPTSWTALIGGGDDDIPRTHVEDGKVCLVGGTVILSGMRRDEERQAVQKVLQLVLYTIQSMTCELELLDAFRVQRELDPLPVPPKDSLPHRHHASSSMSSPRGSVLSRKSSQKDTGERGKGFFQRLGKDTRGMFDGFMGRNKSPERATMSLPRTHSLDHPRAPADTVSDFRPDTPSSSVATGMTTPVVNQATDRYIQTLDKLEASLPSPTPGLRFPMPPLLVRVREEERLRAEKVRQEVAEETGGTLTEVIDGLSRRGMQSLSREDPTRTRGRAYRPGGDVRAGLAALASGIEAFSGWIRLQRLELLTCTGIEQPFQDAITKETTITTTVCEKPKVTSFTFWNGNDETIFDVINGITDEERVCAKAGCDAAQEEHTRWWCHNGRQVGMTVRKVEQGMGEVGLDVYVKCGECKKHTEPRLLNEVAGSFSWGKLLEILLYTDLLAPKSLCEHAQTPSKMITTIRSPHTVLNLTVRPITVLETRLPRLQVGPNVAKRKAARAGTHGTVDGLMRKEARVAAVDAVKLEVETILQRLKERCAEVFRLGEGAGGIEPNTANKPKKARNDDSQLNDSDKLEGIQHDLEAAEVVLASALANTPPGQVNTVRQKVISVYTQFEARLDAIQQRKIDSKEKSEEAEMSRSGLPEYLGKQVHALPGSAILVREAEPSSVIAYTLSSSAYYTELTSTAKSTEEPPNKPESRDETGWSIDVKRRDTPRDLLSLRTITKKRSDASLVKSEHRLPLTVAPNQPSLEVSLEQVEGRSQASDRLDDLVKSISKATAQDPVLTLKTRSPSVSESDASVSGSGLMTTPRLPPNMARRTSDSARSGAAAPPSAFRPTRSVSSTTVPSSPIAPTPSPLAGTTSGVSTPGSATTGHDTITSSASHGTVNGSKDGWSSVTSTFTNSLNTFMRLGSDMGSFRMRGGDRSISSLMGPLSMMSAMDNSLSNSNQDDRPHIQFTYTLPDKLRIECTVYYATAFDSLRRRCAIDRSILDSLARCEPWDAQGGKSKASFFMSGDKRYIVKELVSKWNVSDTQALLEIAPSYFEHLASTHNKAVALAKIVGFFSIKIHDLQTSTKKSMDLVVMENLFYKQTVSQTYDLKGIEGRKVPKTVVEGSTLFDSEWIEGQSKAPILLQPHAKRILQEAIYNDTKYLCSQGIMDYSLLLGLDNQRNELVVGLVDAIGSFNLFKTIESRGKLALTRGGEVTIIPPDQYRERFENALRQYFVACPDKWSKTSRRYHEDSVPSVF